MKKLLTLVGLIVSLVHTNAQEAADRKVFAHVNTGFSRTLNKPSQTAFLLDAEGVYQIIPRLSAGVGFGLATYEEVLLPLFVSVRCNLSHQHLFVPFVEGRGGYAFAPSKKANGGATFSPLFGLAYTGCKGWKPYLMAGYRFQYLEHLKESHQELVDVQFEEQLTHHSFCIRLGCEF